MFASIMFAVRFILGLVILLFLVTFAVKNMEPQITIQYYFGYNFGPMPFFFTLLAAGVLGMVVSAVFSVAEQIRLHTTIRRKRKRIEALEKELLEFKQKPPEPLLERDEEEQVVALEDIPPPQ